MNSQKQWNNESRKSVYKWFVIHSFYVSLLNQFTKISLSYRNNTDDL